MRLSKRGFGNEQGCFAPQETVDKMVLGWTYYPNHSSKEISNLRRGISVGGLLRVPDL